MEELKFTFYTGEVVEFKLSDIKDYILSPENYKMFITLYGASSGKPNRTVRLEFDTKEWYDKNLPNYNKWQSYNKENKNG